MKRPSFNRTVDLLDILYGYHTRLHGFNTSERHRAMTLDSAWDELVCRTDTVCMSRIWITMVQTWMDYGVHGKHVYIATGGSGLSLDMLIKNPADFSLRCKLRGFGLLPTITYPGDLRDGPALDAVRSAQKRRRMERHAR